MPEMASASNNSNYAFKVNAEERKRLKRAIDSKEIWKQSALARQNKLRLQELRIRDLENSRNNWKEKYFRGKDPDAVAVQENENIPPKGTVRELKKDRKKIDFF